MLKFSTQKAKLLSKAYELVKLQLNIKAGLNRKECTEHSPCETYHTPKKAPNDNLYFIVFRDTQSSESLGFKLNRISFFKSPSSIWSEISLGRFLVLEVLHLHITNKTTVKFKLFKFHNKFKFMQI